VADFKDKARDDKGKTDVADTDDAKSGKGSEDEGVADIPDVATEEGTADTGGDSGAKQGDYGKTRDQRK
jgi:hypothetical protein